MLNYSRAHEVFEYREGALYNKVYRGNLPAGKRVGNIGCKGYRCVSIDGISYQEHRVIFLMHHGYMPKNVDHVNGIKDDNRIENMREASDSENKRNGKKYVNNTSGYKNVYREKNKGWKVMIGLNKKIFYFGTYSSKEEAHLVACRERERLHGEFANHDVS